MENCRFEPDFGWMWVMEPIPIPSIRSYIGGKEVAVIQTMNDNHNILIILGCISEMDNLGPQYRPVVFDAHGNRYLFRHVGGAGNDRMLTLLAFELDHTLLSPKAAAFLGIEVIAADGRRRIAQRVAKSTNEKGIQTLPFPEVGQPFDFRLTAGDGSQLDSLEYRGQVVVIDCWRTNCTPCMEKMPKLRSLYNEFAPDHLKVIGINFDSDQEPASKAISECRLSWPQVFISSDRETRDAWEKVSTVFSLPRIFVIDKEGILRADAHPEELDRVVRDLIT